MVMFEAKFGFLPKKKVKLDETVISIGKNDFPLSDIKCIYFRPFNFVKNEWGSVYLSFDGEDTKNENLFAKNTFNFSKGQTSSVKELLALLDLEIIDKSEQKQTGEQVLEESPNALQSKVNEHHENAHAKLAQIQNEKQMSNKVLCTNCGSGDIHFMGNNKKSFSVGKAVAGTVLTGGVGALAGFAGKKGKNQWFCKNCNQVFETKK